jgi:hypothetical protein
MATIVHKGVKLVYDDQGAGTPAFVFIHGLTCDSPSHVAVVAQRRQWLDGRGGALQHDGST